MPKPILILSTGNIPMRFRIMETFAEMFIRLGDYPAIPEVLDVVKSRAYPKDLKKYAGYVITGSLSMVTEAPLWSIRLQKFVRELYSSQSPFLGVCYGHQLAAQALGGVVDYNPRGCELGSHEIKLFPEAQEHPILKGLPESFRANLSHSQTVIKLPKGAQVLASSEYDPHQIISYGPKSLTVQFHPEFDGRTTRGFVDAAVEKRKRLPLPKKPETTVLSLITGVSDPAYPEPVPKRFRLPDPNERPTRPRLTLRVGGNIRDTPESRDILNRFIREVSFSE
jgi:GMP synthase (glutamine-hydrolysing)